MVLNFQCASFSLDKKKLNLKWYIQFGSCLKHWKTSGTWRYNRHVPFIHIRIDFLLMQHAVIYLVHQGFSWHAFPYFVITVDYHRTHLLLITKWPIFCFPSVTFCLPMVGWLVRSRRKNHQLGSYGSRFVYVWIWPFPPQYFLGQN